TIGWLLLLACLAVVPLVPTVSGARPAESPAVKRSKEQTPEKLIATLASCRSCHAPALAKSKPAKDDLHARITPLLAELAKQRGRGKKTEGELKRAVEACEKATKPAKPAPKAAEPAKPANSKPATLEDKLEQLRREVEKLRKDLRGKTSEPALKLPAF